MAFAGVGLRRSALGWDYDPPLTNVASRFGETDLALRFGMGTRRRLGRGELFGELDGVLSRFGKGEERLVEGSVPSGRRTTLDLGLTTGFRIPVE